MPGTRRPSLANLLIPTVLVAWAVHTLLAASAAGEDKARRPDSRVSVGRPESLDLLKVAPSHPLASVLRDASEKQSFLRQTVSDFMCRLVKRERINGVLQEYNYIDMWVRESARDGGRPGRRLSVYMEFLAPPSVAGRRLLYVEGRNDGKMLVRKGGKHFDYVVTKVDPLGETVADETHAPITQSSFTELLGQVIAVLKRHAALDPTGANTRVENIAGAKIDERLCHVVRVTHAARQDGLEFHVSNVFFDDELRVPLRVEKRDWPKQPNEPPPLIAEFTYTQLKLNVGLSDEMFSPGLMRAKR